MTTVAPNLAYRNALDFLSSRIDYERALAMPYGGPAIQLDRMRRLLDELGDPQSRLRIIHIAGTKGKGSTAAMIASMLTAAGYRTGLYTSPHLDRIEERLAVDGLPCTAAELVALVEHVQPAVRTMDAGENQGADSRATYFEIATALALSHFSQRQTDFAVLEVGLGGRLDSTNVCDPLVSVITSISFDHTQQLGNTLAAIAREKAGIIKPSVPVVSGVKVPEARDVIEQVAQQHGCPLTELGIGFDLVYRPAHHLEAHDESSRIDFHYHAGGQPWGLSNAALGLVGAHQAANAAVALATIAELQRLGSAVPEAAIRRGLAQVRWPARVEIIGRHPTVVLDAAHNVASIEAFLQTVEESFSASSRVLVFATTRDKDVPGMLKRLLPKFDRLIFTRYVNNPRSVPPEEMAAAAADIGRVPTSVCADPASAWELAGQLAGPEDLIGITGSFFLAAEMRLAVQARPLDTPRAVTTRKR